MPFTSLIETEQLKKHFEIRSRPFAKKKWIKAVDGVDLKILEGEIFGLVGESGCGKTTLGLALAGIYKPTSGHIFYREQDISKAPGKILRRMSREIQIVFQDPFASLDPTMKVGEAIREPLDIHGLYDKRDRDRLVKEILAKTGLSSDHFKRYPHQFSGGQRQRIAIARAIITNPKFMVADEPVSSLDISVRGQILNLLLNLKNEYHFAMMFISHDLSVVKQICDRIGVMYLGKIVEITDSKNLLTNCKHPYTRALLSAVPIPDPTVIRSRELLKGEVPTPINPPTGCRFHPRCKYSKENCSIIAPLLEEYREGMVACHFWKEISQNLDMK